MTSINQRSSVPRVFQSTPASQPRRSGKRVRLQAPSSNERPRKRRPLPTSPIVEGLHHRSSDTSPAEVRDEPGEPPQDLDEDDTLNEVIMAIDMRNRDTIGCSYYVAREEKLYLLSDVKYGGVEIVETLKTFVEPTVVLISLRVDESVHEHLNPENRNSISREDDSQFRVPYLLEMRPSNEFSYEGGLRKLVDLRIEIPNENCTSFVVPGDEDPYESYRNGLDPGFSHRQGNLLQLASVIDLESRLSVSCSGALLSYIQRRRAVLHLPGDPDAVNTFRISSIEMFNLDGFMSLSADTLISLQILQDDFHPHSHNQGPTNASSGSKEGLSVYGLFHHLAKTPQGKYRLRQLFLRPNLDLEALRERHDAVSVLLQASNEDILGDIVKSLKSIKNMRHVVTNLRKGISGGSNKNHGVASSVWFSLRSFAYYTLSICQAVSELQHAEELSVCVRILEKFEIRHLGTIGKMVTDIVDFTESQEMHRTVVLLHVDDNLDEMKRQYDGLEDMLNHLSREIGQTIPERYALNLNVIFFPQIGFLISMPINPITEAVDYRGEEGHQWREIFHTVDRVYFKDYRMEELDVTVGDIYADICDKEIEIVHDLAQRVLEHATMLCEISDLCAELDCLTALAQGARMYKLTRPRMTVENTIQIKGGWHILQSNVVSTCIANDTFLVGGSQSESNNEESNRSRSQGAAHHLDLDGPSTLLLTGPNYSGKSVYLKQVAIITYMAHVGSFVPAEHAIIGLTDQIFTRISTRETVSRAQSAFMIDLQQVSTALNALTRRSLVVIDEFGKGTNAADGAGLLCGVIHYLLGLGKKRPKVLAATHFHELFEGGYIAEHQHLAFGHMEIRMDAKAKNVEDQVTYLYNLLPGRSTSSFGTVCAALNGIDQSIVDRAEELLLLEAQGIDLVSACSKASNDEQEEEDATRAQEVARRLLALNLQDEPIDEVTGESLDLRTWVEDVV